MARVASPTSTAVEMESLMNFERSTSYTTDIRRRVGEAWAAGRLAPEGGGGAGQLHARSDHGPVRRGGGTPVSECPSTSSQSAEHRRGRAHAVARLGSPQQGTRFTGKEDDPLSGAIAIGARHYLPSAAFCVNRAAERPGGADQAEESAPGSLVGALGGSLSRVPQRAAIMPEISARVWPTSCCSTM